MKTDPAGGTEGSLRQAGFAGLRADGAAVDVYPGARRRLSALETAAAVAVILICLVGTAVMTGVLPVTRRASETVSLPAASASRGAATLPVQTVVRDAAVAAGTAAAGTALAPHDNGRAAAYGTPADTATATGSRPGPDSMRSVSSGNPDPAGDRNALAPPTENSGSTAASASAGHQADVPGPARAPVPATPAATVARAPAASSRHARHRHMSAARREQQAATRPGGKTREEVIAELLRAKRDGSYSGAMEAYR